MKKRLCVIVPAYNESAVIRSVIQNSIKTFSTSKHLIDVVLIDDGSKDASSTEAGAAGAIVVRRIRV